MTTTDSTNHTDYKIEQEAFLKVGNYQSSVFEAINEAKHYISTNNCKYLSIDASGLNMIDAIKVCVLSSTFHFAKYCTGKITWYVRDENIREQIELLRLDNTDVQVKKARKNYIDSENGFVRKLSICR